MSLTHKTHFTLALSQFLGAACHGDLTEKLKLLYKMHVLPGKWTTRGSMHTGTRDLAAHTLAHMHTGTQDISACRLTHRM